jgi:hypothetical protein
MASANLTRGSNSGIAIEIREPALKHAAGSALACQSLLDQAVRFLSALQDVSLRHIICGDEC